MTLNKVLMQMAGKNWLPQPEPGLRPGTVLERARALRPKLREQQDEADQRGWYSDEIHQAFLDGGFYRLLQPRMFGGYEFDLPVFIRVVMEIARGHPSSGWCYCLGSSHSLLVASHWSEQAQRELFGPEGHLRTPHRAPPAGELRRVEGGYIVTGSWNYSSGQFVPDRHIVDSVLLSLPDWSKGGTAGTRLHGNPMYLGIVGGAYHATFGAILTGTAHAALDEYESLLHKNPMMGNPAQRKLHDPASQSVLGEALALTHSAEAISLSVAQEYMDQCWRWKETGQPITNEDTFKLWATAQKGCYLACEAVEKLFHAASASAAHKGQKMQRYFRDIQMYLVHPAAQSLIPQLYAQNHLGLGGGLFGAAH
jgi:3-hydroxy-9,10-secoandrosta-1,3,5(10)-triene-9,17-dione monooxygenase